MRYSRPDRCWCGVVGEENWDADGTPIPCTYCPHDKDPTTPECDDVVFHAERQKRGSSYQLTLDIGVRCSLNVSEMSDVPTEKQRICEETA